MRICIAIHMPGSFTAYQIKTKLRSFVYYYSKSLQRIKTFQFTNDTSIKMCPLVMIIVQMLLDKITLNAAASIRNPQ